MTTKQFGKRLAELRKLKGYSQEDIARFIDIPRSSVAQMELGNRNVTALELVKWSEVLGFSLDRFVAKEYKADRVFESVSEPKAVYQATRASDPVLNPDKFANVVLYILERCGGKPNLGETVLYKLLYFSDFNYFEVYEEHLTGSLYRKLPFGPVPQNIESLIGHMLAIHQLQRIKTNFHGFAQTRFIPLVHPDLTKMSAAEKDVIDKVIERFSDWSASAISDYSHQDMPWKATDEGDIIDYELAFYRESPFSARVYNDEAARP